MFTGKILFVFSVARGEVSASLDQNLKSHDDETSFEESSVQNQVLRSQFNINYLHRHQEILVNAFCYLPPKVWRTWTTKPAYFYLAELVSVLLRQNGHTAF